MATAVNGNCPTNFNNASANGDGTPVATTVRLRFRESHYAVLRQVACEYRDGVLMLRGRVPSYYMKQVAQNIARCVEGVLEIHNQLDVAPLPEVAETA
ncbi:MAG: BON domain-containing protein [Thermoguttaceae bacterium]|jgi:osmotically-inducible protein OsmY